MTPTGPIAEVPPIPAGTSSNAAGKRSSERIGSAFYALAIVVSLSTWFLAINAPLWLDETGSYWDISAGVSQIWSRQTLWFPIYAYILWFSTKIIGASEIALRVPSILAMLGAVYLLYRAAREIFSREIALFAVVIFSLNPVVSFAAIDVRPYAFAALATNATILTLLHLRNTDGSRVAALFGFLAASILYFQYLFAVILPALVIAFFLIKRENPKGQWRQFTAASAAFSIGFLPLIPGLISLFRTSKTHVCEVAPKVADLILTLAPGWLSILAVVLFGAFLMYATKVRPAVQPSAVQWERPLVCFVLGFVPLFILWIVSVVTPIHMFAPRHRLIAVPGIALSWAFLIDRLRFPTLRLVFCGCLVALTCAGLFSSPYSQRHFLIEKYVLQAAEKNASVDNAPVLVCSGFIESDFAPMPTGPAVQSRLFAPLSYYRLSVPVVPLPNALNAEAKRNASRFLAQASHNHQRFLAMGEQPSLPTLIWLTRAAADSYTVRTVGIFDDALLLEFDPRTK